MYITLLVLRLVVSLFTRRCSTPNPGVVGQPINEQHCFEELVWAEKRKQIYEAECYYNREYMMDKGKIKVHVQGKMLQFSDYT